ncbi:hypothetical protein MTO96_014777, partial [Rhipicephalus appendiculatus]
LADALNGEGPIVKSVQQWQDWWRKQVHDARQDAAAIAEVQRSTGGGRAPGFYGRVLELTGTLRLTGVRPLDYQQDDAPPTAPMEVVQGMASSSTSERQPPIAPPRRRPVRPPRQPRARRVDLLSDMQSQCARSLEQGTDLLRVLESIGRNMRRLALAAEENTALLRRSAEAAERTASAQEAILRELRAGRHSEESEGEI